MRSPRRSAKITMPISLHKPGRRDVRHLLEAIGLERVAFQVLQTTNAGLSKRAGVDPKVAR